MISGNRSLLMPERNSDVVAREVQAWLETVL